MNFWTLLLLKQMLMVKMMKSSPAFTQMAYLETSQDV